MNNLINILVLLISYNYNIIIFNSNTINKSIRI